MKYSLAILIPARNEEFLARTIQDLVDNTSEQTEILIGLDGKWAEPGVIDHPRVTIVYYPESIGQRAMTRRLARITNAKYIAKTDAHCAFDKDFDVKMLEAFKETGDDVTMVPIMRNLHVFDWVCKTCGMRSYQGPEPIECRNEECSNDPQKFEKDIVWIPKTSPQSTAYRFNKELRFKYFPELRRRQTGDLVETMSLQGSFFMMTKERYFDLDIDDESLGSWGMQGSSVALKTWLSGGRVICNTRTWYAHLFRTQHGFSFPYPQDGKGQARAIKTVQDVFMNNKWEKQTRPLSWLLEKFWEPLKEVGDKESQWEATDLEALKKVSLQKSLQTFVNSENTPSKGILFYTTNRLPIKFAKKVQNSLKAIGLPIASVSLKPMNFGNNIHVPLQPSKWAYFTQILIGLESMKEDIIFFAEEDVLYSKEHFDFTPQEKDTFYYDLNWWKVWSDGLAARWDARQVSMLCAYRKPLIDFYRDKIKEIEKNGFNRSYEPFGKCVDWKSERSSIDVRHKGNLTRSHRKPEDFRDKSSCINWEQGGFSEIPGWDENELHNIYKHGTL